MKTAAVVAAIAVVVPAIAGQATEGVTISTLTGIVTCEPIKLNWQGGSPPYYVSIIPAQQPSAPPFKIFPTQNSTSYTWIVDLPAGTAFNTMIKDGSGQPNYSAEQIVQSGPDSSCVNANVTVTAGSAATPAPNISQTQAAAAVTGSGTASASVTSHNSSASAVSNTAAAPTHTNSNGAGHTSSVGAIGVAGVLGLLGAALF